MLAGSSWSRMCCPAWGRPKKVRSETATTFVRSAYRRAGTRHSPYERRIGMADISIGVIGAGGMGTRHVLNLQRHVKGARVVAIYDLDQARAQQVAAESGSARAFADPLQLIQDAGVDAVVIASPDPTHAECVHACLRHHK